MDTKQLTEEIKAKNAEIETRIKEQKAKLTEFSKGKLKEVADILFAAYPELYSFGWRQYTQYFNDGDTCDFDVHADATSLTINGHRDSEDAEDNGYPNLFEGYNPQKYVNGGYVPNPNYNPRYEEAIDTAASIIRAFDEEVLKAIFNDHVEVTVSREEVYVEGYSDHD